MAINKKITYLVFNYFVKHESSCNAKTTFNEVFKSSLFETSSFHK